MILQGNLMMKTMRECFFVIKDILYNLQDKSGIPASWKLLDRHCGSFLQPEDAIQHS